jgi:hypothetical protein
MLTTLLVTVSALLLAVIGCAVVDPRSSRPVRETQAGHQHRKAEAVSHVQPAVVRS